MISIDEMFEWIVEDPFFSPSEDALIRVTDAEVYYEVGSDAKPKKLTDEDIERFYWEWNANKH